MGNTDGNMGMGAVRAGNGSVRTFQTFFREVASGQDLLFNRQKGV